MHEYGHGLYNHQLPRALGRLPIGQPASLGIHESQSRLWENLVGRSLPFWRFFYPRLREVYPEQLAGVELDRFLAGINRVQPSLIRIKADEVTYGLHVMLRFELEQDIVEGRVELRDLPEAWNQKMWDSLGVEVPDDAHGVLQDVHWSGGQIGYFSTYLLGTVMSVQIWEAAGRDLPELEEQIGRGEFAPLREWLGEHVHALGRRYNSQETLRRATGSTIAPEPYLAYLRAKYASPPESGPIPGPRPTCAGAARYDAGLEARRAEKHSGDARREAASAAPRAVRREQHGPAQPARASKQVANGTRTRDHRDHNPGLYQLSYRHREADTG